MSLMRCEHYLLVNSSGTYNYYSYIVIVIGKYLVVNFPLTKTWITIPQHYPDTKI